MKTALMFFSDKISSINLSQIETVLNSFKMGGITIDSVEVISNTDEHGFKLRLDEAKDLKDNLIIVDDGMETFNVKEIVCETMGTDLAENANALSFLHAVSKADGVRYPEDFALLPTDAILIPNVKGAFQGYMLEENEFSLIVLPNEVEQLKIMCEEYVIPYFESKYGISTKKLTLKYFGDLGVLDAVLSDANVLTDNKMEWRTETKNGDTTIDLLFSPYAIKTDTDNAVRFIVSRLKDNIYAEYNCSLSERLFDILKLKKLKISVAESFTGGRVVSEIIKNSGVSEFLREGIVSYSNESKVERLFVKEQDLKNHGAVSAEVAYQMALGLLKKPDVDVAIATTGIAGPKSDNTFKPVGLTFIAVGMKDGIHVYKHNFTGDREEITETAKNTALYLTIKKLKNL